MNLERLFREKIIWSINCQHSQREMKMSLKKSSKNEGNKEVEAKTNKQINNVLKKEFKAK